MRKLLDQLWERLPAQFRVLHRQFLLRVIDLEALSIEADIPKFLGQFAGVLMMFSLLHGLGVVWFPPAPSRYWGLEQARISDILLVVGLSSVLTWDTTFPDRRDVMVLGTLPLSARVILLAKLSASGSLLGMAVLALNFASSLGESLVLGGSQGGLLGVLRYFGASWWTFIAAAVFLYGAVLTVQGFAVMLLPRRAFLQISALLQLVAFGVFLGARFLQPTLPNPQSFLEPANQHLIQLSPAFWFVAMLNQLNGTLPSDLDWLAARAWLAVVTVVLGAGTSLLLCYLRTMKKTVEEPDLVPSAGGWHWRPRWGSSLHSAIVLFCFRSIVRSRQHRLALAFYWSVVFAITLSWARSELIGPPQPISVNFLVSTFLMVGFGVLGLRGVFSLPIALRANWILRITQLRPTSAYIGSTRRCLTLFGVVPIWTISAILSLHLEPWQHAAEHLAFLMVIGLVLVELGLMNFDKVPFTCSYLPGKTNIQVIFWGFTFVLFVLAGLLAMYEYSALQNGPKFALLVGCALVSAVVLRIFNDIRARTAELYFEEVPAEIITRLGLVYIPPPEPSQYKLIAQ